MNELDPRTRKASMIDMEETGEPPLWSQFMELFRGRLRWINGLTLIGTLAFAVFTVVSAVYFFRAEGIREMIAWASGFGLGLISVTAGRIWIWIQVHRNTILRELKRLELQIARLSDELKKP